MQKKKKAYPETAGKVFCRIVKRAREKQLQNLQMRKRLLMYQLNTSANVNKMWEVCLR